MILKCENPNCRYLGPGFSTDDEGTWLCPECGGYDIIVPRLDGTRDTVDDKPPVGTTTTEES